MRADVHMHTSFSHDSEAEPREMIEGAIAKGLEVICFTDHYDKDYMGWGDESIFDADAYFGTLRPLQEEYRDRIDIRIGVELGMQPRLGGFFTEFTKKYPFDFVIGSLHVVDGADPALGTVFEGRTDEEVYRQAFVETLEDIENTPDFDVLGHIDYVVRYGKNGTAEYSYRKYADEIDAILRAVIERGKGIELNMAGLKYGLPFAHPHPDILRRYRELGGEIITVGADGHRPEHIAYDFEKADSILKSCGFRYYTEFKERKPVFKLLT